MSKLLVYSMVLLFSVFVISCGEETPTETRTTGLENTPEEDIRPITEENQPIIDDKETTTTTTTEGTLLPGDFSASLDNECYQVSLKGTIMDKSTYEVEITNIGSEWAVLVGPSNFCLLKDGVQIFRPEIKEEKLVLLGLNQKTAFKLKLPWEISRRLFQEEGYKLVFQVYNPEGHAIGQPMNFSFAVDITPPKITRVIFYHFREDNRLISLEQPIDPVKLDAIQINFSEKIKEDEVFIEVFTAPENILKDTVHFHWIKDPALSSPLVYIRQQPQYNTDYSLIIKAEDLSGNKIEETFPFKTLPN